ncbi:MAG: hypothetical protein AB1411_11655 [Nitrospirota bacterium]
MGFPRDVPSPRITPSVIWLLCHYPDTAEADERVERAVALYLQSRAPIWLYGSNSARYPESVEQLLKRKLVLKGVAPEAITCSGELSAARLSLDTVQEACNVAADARANGVGTLVCVSNRLQLAQVRGLLRREPLSFTWVVTPLRDRRWWYVLGRLMLIPLAYLGVGPRFAPLVFVRWARARLAAWPF